MAGKDHVMERIEFLNQRIDVTAKSFSMDFEKVYKIIRELSKMLDLQYLELAVIMELLAKKGLMTEEEFKNQLDETSEKIMATAKAEMDKNQEAEKRSNANAEEFKSGEDRETKAPESPIIKV